MKIHFERQKHHGRAMKRIEDAIKQRAPQGITFTPILDEADVQFLHYIGTSEIDRCVKKKFVVFAYCFEGAINREKALRAMEGASLVYSYLDIPGRIGSDNMNFYRAPLGVDTSVFRRTLPAYRDVLVTTTGYVSGSEGIESCIVTAGHYGKFCIHVGGDISQEIGYNPSTKYLGLYHRKEGITDDELVSCYNRSHFVSGMRLFEGFELPVLEGSLCGARPICFDLPCYREWFGDLPIYVPQCTGKDLTERLMAIMANPVPVTQEESDRVAATFSWDVIAAQFWARFLESVK